MNYSNIYYVNLRAEMARGNIGIGQMAKALHISRDTMARKLAGRSPLHLDEAFRVQRKLAACRKAAKAIHVVKNHELHILLYAKFPRLPFAVYQSNPKFSISAHFKRREVHMPREKETFRLELEEILKFTGGRRVLTVTDVSNYTGQSRRVCRERYNVSGKEGISAVALAQMLAR